MRRPRPGGLPIGVALLAALGASPAAGAELFVVCQSGAAVSVIDTATLSEAGRIPIDTAPAGIAFSPDGASAYVTHPDLGRLTRIDTASRRVAATADIGGQPFGVAASPEGQALYVGDWSEDRVLRLDAQNLQRTGVVEVGHAPAGLTIDPVRARLYSADRESDAVSVIDLSGFSRIASLPVGTAPFALDGGTDPTRLAVADVRSGDVAIIDKDRHTVRRIDAGRMPYGVAFVPGGHALLATDQQSGRLRIIDPEGVRKTVSVRIGGSPEGVIADPSGLRAYVAEWFANEIAVIDLPGATVSSRIKVCDGPRMMALRP